MPANDVRCDLCGITVTPGSLQSHLDGRKHQANLRARGAKSAAPAPPMPPPVPPPPARATPAPSLRASHSALSAASSVSVAPRAPPQGPPAAFGGIIGNMQACRQCPRCTLINPVARAHCEACTTRLADVPVVYIGPGADAGSTSRPCPQCDAENPVDAAFCFVCGCAQPGAHTGGNFGAPQTRYVGRSHGGRAAASAAAADDEDEVVEIVPHTRRGRSAQTAATHVDNDADVDLCVVCLEHVADHGFQPCGHRIICAVCASNDAPATCYVCRAPVMRVVCMRNPVPVARGAGIAPLRSARRTEQGAVDDQTTLPLPAGASWRPPRSTFPWMGGEESNWDSFVTEIEAAAAAYVAMELGGLYTNAHIKRCRWTDALERRIKDGWRMSACPEGSWAGVFGWHGSTRGTQSLHAIAKHGFDPATRARNAHGSGEYFAVHHSQAVEYARASNRALTYHGDLPLILGFALRGPHLSWVEDFCFIVDNPTDEPVTYAAPMFLVHFTRDQPAQRWAVPRFPFRWQFGWENDDNDGYIVYDHDTNKRLNQLMCCKYGGVGDESSTEVRLERDGTTCTYRIDLQTMTQTNLETDFMRKLNIQCVPSTPLPKTLWMALREADEVQREDHAITSGMDRRRFDRVSGGPPPGTTQFWLVLDMFSQRTLSDGYYKFYGQPSAITGEFIPARKNMNARFGEVTIHGKVMRADFSRMRLHPTVFCEATNTFDSLQPGWPLAVVES